MKTIFVLIFTIVTGCGGINNYIGENYNKSEYLDVTIEEIINNPNFYDSKKVKIKGTFYYGMEESSIVSKNNPKNILWIDFNYYKKLLDSENNSLYDNERLLKCSGKKIILKGVFDKNNTGHLGIYRGAVKNILFFGDNDSK